jgi:hypothetical protein
VNRKIILDRFSHEHADFRFGEARDDVVSRPTTDKFTNLLGRHFTSRATHEQCHFKDQVSIGARPLMGVRSYWDEQPERDKFAVDKSHPLLAPFRMLMDHTMGSREHEADSFRSSLTGNSVSEKFASRNTRRSL